MDEIILSYLAMNVYFTYSTLDNRLYQSVMLLQCLTVKKKVAGINVILCSTARKGAVTRVGSEADDLGVCAKGELSGQT